MRKNFFDNFPSRSCSGLCSVQLHEKLLTNPIRFYSESISSFVFQERTVYQNQVCECMNVCACLRTFVLFRSLSASFMSFLLAVEFCASNEERQNRLLYYVEAYVCVCLFVLSAKHKRTQYARTLIHANTQHRTSRIALQAQK